MNRFMNRCLPGLVALALAVPALTAIPLVAQQEAPPAPLAPRPISFPPFEQFVMPNGLQVVVVNYGTQPVVTARLFLRAGEALVPANQAGLAGFVGDMLNQGTESRSALQISETIEGVGGVLSSSTGNDYLSISFTTLLDHMGVGFDLMADVVQRATFPQEEIELLRRRVLSSLQAQLGQPQAVANRIFSERIYGDGHPYGVSATPASVSALTRDDLVSFRDRFLRPDGALLLVAGGGTRAEVESMATRYLGGWEGTPAAPSALPALQERQGTEIVLVHRPGSVQSVIVAGHLGPQPGFEDVAALTVANRILGGGADARLFRILREEKGWTYGAYSSFNRPLERGVFTAGAEVRTVVTDSATVEILHQLDRMASEETPADELDAARNYLAGNFPLQLETANQVGGRIADVFLYNRDLSDVTEFPQRIRQVSAADVQRVARQQIRARDALVVVVGDGRAVLESLEAIAPVTVIDVEGNPLSREDVLPATDMPAAWDASRLEAGVRTYSLQFQGNPLGTATYRLERDGDLWISTQTLASAMAGNQSTQLRFSAEDFAPVSLRQSQSAGGMDVTVTIDVVDGRFVGTANLPAALGGARDVDTPVGEALLPGMDEYAMAASQLAEGTRLSIPYLDVTSGEPVLVEARVTGRETIEVPAGSFDTWRVEVTSPQGVLTLYLSADAPHILIRQNFPPGQPISLELTEISPL
jgi:predicted Zn-dependent peptidase